MKKDRNGILVLMVLIVLTIAAHFVVENIEVGSHNDYSEAVKAYDAWRQEISNKTKSLSLFHFNPNTISEEQLDSLNLPQYVKINIIRYREAGGKFNSTSDLQKIYGMNDSIYNAIETWMVFTDNGKSNEKEMMMPINRRKESSFDPNYASADELNEFGFNEFQATNIEKYRAAGGKFHSPGDVMKIYGVDSDLFMSIKEHIQIDESKEAEFLKEIVVELNSADSLELVKLKGIGPVFANRIIKYRNLLGGYFTVDQLLEVYGFPEETFEQLKGNFVADTLHLKKIRINFAGYAELLRHPYIEKGHVETILDYREKHGPFTSEHQLLRNGLVDSVSYLRIKPYLTCR